MTDHLDEAFDGLMEAGDWGAVRDAALALVAHLRSLPSEPKVEPGEGEPVPFRQAHDWLRDSQSYAAAFSRLRAHVEQSYVRASGPSPKEAEGLVERVIAECRAAKAHPPAALELTDEEVRELGRIVERARRFGEDTDAARESLRKLNARAGSEGAKARFVEKVSHHKGCATESAHACDCDPIRIINEEPTPPAASETAKCATCRDTGVVGFGRACKRCPACGTGARPSPQTNYSGGLFPEGIKRACTACGAKPGEDCKTGHMGAMHYARVKEPNEGKPAPAISKTETVGEAGASEADGARRMYEHARALYPSPHWEGLVRAWRDLRPSEREQEVFKYRFVRAESEQRVRELEQQKAVLLNAGRRRIDVLEGQLHGMTGERDSEREISQGWENKCDDLEQQLATLKAEKEAIERKLDEWRNWDRAGDDEPSPYEKLLNEKEAAEARVLAWEPVVDAALDWVRNGVPLPHDAGEKCERLYRLVAETHALREELRPQSPESGK